MADSCRSLKCHTTLNAKVIFLGELGTGKSSLAGGITNEFPTNPHNLLINTSSPDIRHCTVNIDDTTSVKMQLWNIFGEERYGRIGRIFYKRCFGVLLLYDITIENTFVHLRDFWLKKVRKQYYCTT